jgi:hypothetical protein
VGYVVDTSVVGFSTRGAKMDSERFGQYLVNRGVVDEEAIIDALNIQRKRTIPIGKIGLEEKVLSFKEVFDILNAQVNTPKLFGEVAVELGYLTEKEVDRLLKIQQERRPHTGEILLEMNKLDKETLDIELENYFKKTKEARIKG